MNKCTFEGDPLKKHFIVKSWNKIQLEEPFSFSMNFTSALKSKET